MKARKIILALLALTFVAGMAVDSYADISNAAVLFLRIAPGSRAAGMGEAYVAIADDATATHWNPAGLGNSPLASTWIVDDVPEEFRPIKAMAAVSTGGDRSYEDFDIWAISSKGLVRFDNKRWNTGEIFSTRTDETVKDKVRDYFSVSDDEHLANIVERVAAVNNEGTIEDLQGLRDKVLAVTAEDHADRARIEGDLDSLLICFDLCRVNWDKVREAQERYDEAMQDSVLSEDEVMRISVALERSRRRFVPEELTVPYDALMGGELTAIMAIGDNLLVGSTEGLAVFNGKFWKVYTAGESLPSSHITVLSSLTDRSALIGTDSGIAVFNGLTINPLTVDLAGLPVGEVQAIGGNAMTNVYAVVNGDLYHFGGRLWTNTTAYKVEVDDTVDKIAAEHSLYGSQEDLRRYVEKYKTTASFASTPEDVKETPETVEDTAEVKEPPADSAATAETEATEEIAEVQEELPEVPAAQVPGVDVPLNAGDDIVVPFLAGIKGRTRVIYVDINDVVWLGTDYGVFYFDGAHWISEGYREHVVAEGESFESLAALRVLEDSTEADIYKEELKIVNDLGDQPLEVGQSVRLYANPAAAAVYSISGKGKRVLFGTEDGVIEYDGSVWSRADLSGLEHANIVGVAMQANELWVASDEKIVIKGRGQSEISFMHVNWLPELADDLYYEFLSAVAHKEGWGTFGGNITFISYGKFARTNEDSPTVVDEFESFDIAFTLSYGTSLTRKLKGGVSAKFIYSRLADQGAMAEQGSGTATGFAVDFGLLYLFNSRLSLGLAVTNLGPKMAYIDAAQSDDLPRNLAIGFAYKLIDSDYNRLIVTAEMNKMLVGLDDNTSKELQEMVFNGGAEFTYANLISARAGYIYDEEGEIKTPTLGMGLLLFDKFGFDFSYIPSQDDFSLANTLRISLRVLL